MSIVGHSMGGMVSLTYAGAFPETVSRLVVLDGVTSYPARRAKPADVRITDWIGDLDKLALRKTHRYASIADGAERILHRSRHLGRAQAMHLATHGLKQNPDGTYGWKFDPYLRARAPYRLSLDDYIGLWSRITCPTLLVSGNESFLPDPSTAGVMKHFQNATLARIEGAGHWLQHDKPDEVFDFLKKFLEQAESERPTQCR